MAVLRTVISFFVTLITHIYKSHIYGQIPVTSESLILAETYFYRGSPKGMTIYQVNYDLSSPAKLVLL
jgi:hypothetical protein